MYNGKLLGSQQAQICTQLYNLAMPYRSGLTVNSADQNES
jgi:hypothetical protein